MEIPKILITTEADQCLEQMLKKVNDGFDSGRVKKTQLASWIMLEFYKQSFIRQMKKIRADHFDKIAHLKAIVKQMEAAKKTDVNLELNRLLSPLKDSGGSRHKKPKPNTQE